MNKTKEGSLIIFSDILQFLQPAQHTMNMCAPIKLDALVLLLEEAL